MMRKRLSLLCLMLLLPCVVWAIDSPIIMLQSVSEQMIMSLKQHRVEIKNNPNYVCELTEKILVPHVDVDAMSRLALGRAYWLSATPVQREAFKKQFLTVMIRTYSSALSAYTDEEIQFKPLRVDPNDQERLQIDSLIIQRGGPAIPVTYRVFQRNGTWKVYDITVDGVSMVQSFHSQFAHQLSKGSMDDLLESMQQHATQLSQ
jgi:phospholipid transport system substrate-binding protein